MHTLLQVVAVPPPHVPLAWQVSPEVQALPSLQPAPVLTTQAPVAVEQVVHPPQAAPALCHAPVESHT
jgi:hypothetical protein